MGNGTTLQEFAYSDVPSGAVASETDTPSGSLSPADYTYNAQSQVTQDTPGSGSANTYVEDASGNLTTLPNGASGTYDDASELTSAVKSGTTTSYTYDASGNRLEASVLGSATVTATYNGAGEVTGYDDAAANTTTATYNGQGLRTSASTTPSGGGSTTQNFVWNTVAAVPEVLMDSTNAYLYGPSGTPFEQVNLATGTIHYLVADALGSVRGVVSAAGALAASTSYDAWGNPETTGGLSSYTPIGFAGGYSDPTGLLYLINRYYDPSTGQFASVDLMVNQTNQPYLYAGDDPVNGVDPMGLCSMYGSTIYPGPCATTATQALQDEAFIQAQANFNSGQGFSVSKGLDAVGRGVVAVAHNPGTTLEVLAAGVCVAASAGICAGFVTLATGAELLQQEEQGGLTGTDVAGTLLLGATDLLSAGITGLVDKIATGATVGFTEAVLYKGVTYVLRVLSVSPSVVIVLSTPGQAGASTIGQCR